jgi:hypothetical protein
MLSPYCARMAAEITRKGIKALNIASNCRHNPGCRSSIASSLDNLCSDMALDLVLNRFIGSSGHRIMGEFELLPFALCLALLV